VPAGTKGQVESIEEDGSAKISLVGWNWWRAEPLSVPLEFHDSMEVSQRAGDDSPPNTIGRRDRRSLQMMAVHSKAFDLVSANKVCALAIGAAILLLIVIVSTAHRPGSRSCTVAYQDCRRERSCCDESHTCYEKSDFWAGCLPSCKPGVHDDEEPQWRSPWTCRVLQTGRRLGSLSVLDDRNVSAQA